MESVNQNTKGLLRLREVLKIIPVGRSTWLAGVKEGKFPAPVKISSRCTAWKVEDIEEFIASLKFESQ